MVGHVGFSSNLCAPVQRPNNCNVARVCATLPAAEPVDVERMQFTHTEQRLERGDGVLYSSTSSLTYERIRIGAVPSPAPAEPESPLPAAPPAGNTDDDVSQAPVPRVVEASFRHVIVNATSITYLRSTAAAPAATELPGVDETTTETTTGPAPSGNGVTPAPASDDAVPETVQRLSAEDFRSLRVRTLDRSMESSLSLRLRTVEGDLVTLEFRQLDVMSRVSARGVLDSGDRVRVRDHDTQSSRFVDMSIDGDISEDEQQAIDDLLLRVIEVANRFFRGDVRAALSRLQQLEFSPDALAEVSLRMSLEQSRESNHAFIGDDGALRDLVHRDRQVSQTLSLLADEQRSLIEAAKSRFDDTSAVRFVRELLPRLLAGLPPPAEPMPTEPTSAESTPAEAAVG